MAVNSIGSSNTYIYDTVTGRLAAKDGSKDDFADYFNGDITGKLPDTLNGFDQKQKNGINNMLMLLQSGCLKLPESVQGQNVDVYEITTDMEDVVTAHFSVNGKRLLTAYDAGAFAYIDHIMADGLLYKTRESKAYDPSDNSINIAIGDVFDLGNGYRLAVKEDHIQIRGLGSGSEQEDREAEQLAHGLNALIHFADQQWISEMIDKESTPKLLNLLRELGTDTDRPFRINGTKCEIRHGRIREAGSRFAVPGSVFNKALKKYEEFLYTPIADRVNMKA